MPKGVRRSQGLYLQVVQLQVSVSSRVCAELREFFFCREPGPPYDNPADRDNCELSDRDSRDLDINNPTFFDTSGNYDYYERSFARDGIEGECLDGKDMLLHYISSIARKQGCFR